MMCLIASDRLAHEDNWWGKYKIWISERGPEPYSEMLARSKFCLVAPGDGWSARAEDAILHGKPCTATIA
jgi:hypothetical protein